MNCVYLFLLFIFTGDKVFSIHNDMSGIQDKYEENKGDRRLWVVLLER